MAVKSVKRLLRANTSASGSLNTDKVVQGLLQLRNTPDADCQLSPAEIIFGKPLRDSMTFMKRLDKYKHSEVKPLWRDAWAAKENALRTRFIKSSEQLNQHSRHLEPMSVGDKCFVQNQSGNYPKRWDRSGTIVEVGPNDQYSIKIDGSGRITIRNRRFLRKFTPASTDVRPDPTCARSYLDPDTSTDINQDNISDGSALSDLVHSFQPDTGLNSTLPTDTCPESFPTLPPLSTPQSNAHHPPHS